MAVLVWTFIVCCVLAVAGLVSPHVPEGLIDLVTGGGMQKAQKGEKQMGNYAYVTLSRAIDAVQDALDRLTAEREKISAAPAGTKSDANKFILLSEYIKRNPVSIPADGTLVRTVLGVGMVVGRVGNKAAVRMPNGKLVIADSDSMEIIEDGRRF